MSESLRHVSSFLDFAAAEKDGGSVHGLIILNNRLPWFTPFLWKKAQLHVCADGGANRLFDELPALLPPADRLTARERYKPAFIKGDMDSIRSDVKEFYAGLGTTILDESYDQDTTDLHKCVSFVQDSLHNKTTNLKLLVVGALGGRLDHELANINVLYAFSGIQIILLSDESLAFLLRRGCHHEIMINPIIEGPHCGLIPVGGPSQCTTTNGLKWNLEKHAMQFGGLISTSNLCERTTIGVCSDADLIWTISIEKLRESFQIE